MDHEIRNFGIRPDEVKDATPDYLASRFNVCNRAIHPRAESWLGDDMTLGELCASLGRLKAIQQNRDVNNLQAIHAGLTSDDFGDALTSSLRRLVATEYGAESDHRLIAAPVPVRDFREHSFPTLDVADPLAALGDNAELTSRVTLETSTGEMASLSTIGALIVISRQVVINDDTDAIDALIRQITAHASRREARAVYGVLEDNGNLSDGNALFNATDGNLLTGTAFDKAGLSEAVALLRRQSTPSGEESNLPAANLIVPPEKEIDAMEVVSSLSNNRPPIRVVSTPWVASNHWYVTASSDRAPVVGLLRLQGADSSVSVTRAPRNIKIDGLGVKVRADYGATAMSRVGAIRCEAP